MPKVHIGKKIKEMVSKSQYTVEEFAKLIGLTRNGAYKIFEKEYIATNQLKKISKILNHDFFKYLSQDLSVGERKGEFGYATKEDIAHIQDAMANILTSVEKLTRQVEYISSKLPGEKLPSKKKYSSAKPSGKK